MRKLYSLLLLTAALVCLPWSVKAEDQTLTVADGTTLKQQLPMHGYNGDAAQHNQFIFLSNELAVMDGATIKALTFYMDKEYTWKVADNAPVATIRFAEVDVTTVSPLVTVTESFQQVYSAKIAFADNKWSITLDEAYEYNGGNLLIDIQTTAASYISNNSSTGSRFYSANVAYGRGIYNGSTALEYIPKTTFTYEAPACAKPANVIKKEVTATTATLAWDKVDEANWQYIILRADATLDWANAVATTDTFAVVDTLKASTDYKLYVRRDCSTEQSKNSSVAFTTDFACTKTGDPSVSEITSESAVISWTSTASAWKLDYQVDGADTWTTIDVTENPYTLTDLATLTSYNVRVRANCGEDGLSDYSEVASFATILCADENKREVSYTLTDSYGDGWGGAALKIVHKESGKTLETLTLGSGSSTSGTLNLCCGEELSFVWLTASQFDYECGFTLTDTFNDEVIIEHTSGTPSGTLAEYTIKCVKASCTKPTGLAASEVEATTATLSWSAEVDSFKVQYTTDKENWGEEIPVKAKTLALAELAPNTKYYARVKAVCGETESSDYCAEIEFTTACEVATMPFAEDFGSAMPSCWSTSYTYWGSSSYQWQPSQDQKKSGSYSMQVNSYQYSSSNIANLETPSIAIADKANLLFYYLCSNAVPFSVVMKVNGKETELASYTEAKSSWGNTPTTIAIPDTCVGKEISIVFRAIGAGTNYKRKLYIDSVAIDYQPVATPTELAAVAGNKSATITWTSEETKWNLRYRPQGAEPEADWVNVADLTEKSKELTGLENSTTYEVQVQAVVSANRKSAWTASATFTPQSCAAVETVTFGTATYNSVVVNWTTNGAGTWDLRYQEGELGWNDTIAEIEATSYKLTGLATYHTYTIEVRPSCGGNDSWVAAEAFTPVYTAPVANDPTNITDAAATFSWSAVADAEGYRIAVVGRETLPIFGEKVTTKTDTTITGLAPATEYDFLVAAVYGEDLMLSATKEFATVTIAPKDLEQVGESTTDGASFQWAANGTATNYQWSTDNTNWSAAIDSTHVTLKGLNSGSSYTFYVRSYYSETVQSAAINLPFTTECGSIVTSKNSAWVEDFENGVNCWQMLRKNTNFSLPAVSTADKKEGEKSLRFYGSGSSSNSIAVLPMTAKDIKKLQISFFYKNASTYTSRPQFGVGYITNPENVATYTQLKAIDRNTAWTNTGNIDLSDATSGAYIAICYYGGSNDVAGFVDSVVVSEQPTCKAPKNLEASTLYNGAALTWTAGNEETAWVVEYSTFSDFSEVTAEDVETTPSIELTGLTTGTKYYARVKAACGGEDFSAYSDVVEFTPSYVAPTGVIVSEITTTGAKVTWTANSGEAAWTLQYRLYGTTDWNDVAVETNATHTFTGLESGKNYEVRVLAGTVASDTETFATDCPASVAPLDWAEGFEGYAAGSKTSPKVPNCWSVLGANNGDYPYVFVTSDYKNTGSKSLEITNEKDKYALVVFPVFSTDLTALQITFSHKEESATSSGVLELGYLTNATDSTTFVVLDSCTASTSWKEELVSLTAVPSGARLAFRYISNSTWDYYTCIDDIVISEIPACPKPENLAYNELTDSSVKLSWTSEASAWKVEYSKNADFSESTVVAANANPFVLEGLDPQTTYYVRVKAVCEENESEFCTAIDFTTDCAVRTMDYKPSLATELPECWTFTGKSGGWKIVNNLLRYEKNTGFAGAATLPVIHIEGNYPSIRAEYSNKSGQNVVAASVRVVADDVDSTYTLAEHSSIALMELDLAKFKGKDVTITINVASGSCVFDVETFQVINKPLYTPQNVAAQAGDGQATITWEAGSNETKWQLYYFVKGESESTWSDELTEKTYIITGLTNGTTYCVHVKGFYEIGGWTVGSDVVEFTPSKATAIDNTEAADKAYKVVENGQVVIIRNGEKRTILGTKIQ